MKKKHIDMLNEILDKNVLPEIFDSNKSKGTRLANGALFVAGKIVMHKLESERLIEEIENEDFIDAEIID